MTTADLTMARQRRSSGRSWAQRDTCQRKVGNWYCGTEEEMDDPMISMGTQLSGLEMWCFLLVVMQ